MADQRAVSEKHHVGTAGLGMQQPHVGNAVQNVVEALPLREGEIT
jgi:hypothetical protein